MLQFIYTFSESRRRNGPSVYKATVYRLTRNGVVLVAEGSDSYVSEFQLVMQLLERAKALPKKAFVRSSTSSSLIHGSAWALREAGIANVEKV